MLSEVLQGHTQDQLSDHDMDGFVEASAETAAAVYWESTSDVTKHYIPLLCWQLKDGAHDGD